MTTPSSSSAPISDRALLLRGRASLEWAVLFAALALLFPEAAVVGMVFAGRARRHGCARWRAALAACIWCGLLGAVIRARLRLGIVP